jgi:hypothetical protein
MRRGFWLAAGAVLGVAGYRRATRLLAGLSHGAAVEAPRAAVQGHGSAGRRGAPVSRAATRSRPESASRLASAVTRIGAAVGFARDVRDGMAEYLELHQRELARNLGDRSNRTSSG